MVPDTQLRTDLEHDALPNFSLVVPNQCHDMHGTLGCIVTPHGRSGVGKRNIGLVSAADTYVGNTVDEVMTSKQWPQGRNAIVITWDEDDYSDEGQRGTGCCGFDPGGGHVATIVITNKTVYRSETRRRPTTTRCFARSKTPSGFRASRTRVTAPSVR